MERLWLRVEKTGDCWLWSGCLDTSGYGNIRVRGKVLRCHRVAWELTHGTVPPGLHVLHRCDVRRCLNPAHLFLGTNADNVADKKAKGRVGAKRGEEQPSAKLTENDVRSIRWLVETGTSQRAVAGAFEVSKSQVSRIVHGERWRYLSEPAAA
jgi:hypothetical protein